MHFNGTSFTDRVHFLVGFPLDIDALDRALKQLCELCDQRIAEWSNLGSFADHGAVHVADFEGRSSHQAECLTQEKHRVGVLVGGIRVGEESSDVGKTECSQDRIGHRMQQYIAIGMRDGSCVMRNMNAAQDERLASAIGRECFESMQVVAMADAHPVVSPLVGLESADRLQGCLDRSRAARSIVE